MLEKLYCPTMFEIAPTILWTVNFVEKGSFTPPMIVDMAVGAARFLRAVAK
jgi:hypothetical protein